MTRLLLPLYLVLIISDVSLCAQSLDDARSLQYSHPDSAIIMSIALQSQLKDDTTALSNSFEIIGIAQWVSGRYGSALDAHNKALELREQINFTSGTAHSHNNLGLVFWKMNNHPRALEHYHTSLELAETNGDSLLMANVLGNIGILHEEQNDWKNALQFYQRSLALLKKSGDHRSTANTLNNIALINRHRGDFEKAQTQWLEALQLYGKLNDTKGVALTLNNLGLLYSDRDDFQTADSLFDDAQTLYQQRADSSGLAMVLGNLGANAKSRGEFDQAIEMCQKSYDMAKRRGLSEYVLSACECLADAHAMSGDHKIASEYLWEYIQLSDSVAEQEVGKQVALMQMRYEHQKEQLETTRERERERAMAEAEIQRQRLLRNGSLLVGALILIVLILLIIGFRRKQRANKLLKTRNKLIVEQRGVIAKRSEEITESINYARRLQEARLPSDNKFDAVFSRWHVLFRPKDIVSGDFYWLEEVDGLVYLAVADCTGHGVPGAMVSMVGLQGLSEALFVRKLRAPGDILEFLDRTVKDAFAQSDGAASDGMDISLVCLDPSNKNMIFAGAYNPLWIFSNRKKISGAELRESEMEWRLHEVKATRYSIGGLPAGDHYNNHIIPYKPEETLALFSDGMADQFGGPNNKKMGIKNLRKAVFRSLVREDMSHIDSTFLNWKGERDQLDDVSVICVSLGEIKTVS